MSDTLHFRRILLKISGESLSGTQDFGVDHAACTHVAASIGKLLQAGYQVGLVMGGGNFCRGRQLKSLEIPQGSADQMGMLATLMNGIALHQTLLRLQIPSELYSAVHCPQFVTTYSRDAANQALNEGKVALFVGGTGNPFLTTDTNAAIRAADIGADLLLKATKVDGVYDKDPLTEEDAIFYPTISYSQALLENLQVMDATALLLCRDNKIPIYVFNMNLLGKENFITMIQEKTIGTLVTGE